MKRSVAIDPTNPDHERVGFEISLDDRDWPSFTVPFGSGGCQFIQCGEQRNRKFRCMNSMLSRYTATMETKSDNRNHISTMSIHVSYFVTN